MKPKFLLNNYTRRYYQGNNEFNSNMQLQSLISNNSKQNHKMSDGIIDTKNYQTINHNICNSNHNSRPFSGRISNSAHLNLYSNYTVNDYFQTHHNKSIALINSLKNKKFESEMNSIRAVPQINNKSKKMKINRKPIYNQIPKPTTGQNTLNSGGNTKLVSISSVKQTKIKSPKHKSSNISSPSLPETTSIKTPQTEILPQDDCTTRQQMRQNDLNKFRHFANNIMN